MKAKEKQEIKTRKNEINELKQWKEISSNPEDLNNAIYFLNRYIKKIKTKK